MNVHSVCFDFLLMIKAWEVEVVRIRVYGIEGFSGFFTSIVLLKAKGKRAPVRARVAAIGYNKCRGGCEGECISETLLFCRGG